MTESTEELEPLFDYSRVQPLNFVCIDDDFSDSSPASSPKRRKTSGPAEESKRNVVDVIDCEKKDEEDWLPPPPQVSGHSKKLVEEDSTIKEWRLKKQELLLFAQSAKDLLKDVEESAKRELRAIEGSAKRELNGAFGAVAKSQKAASSERPKIVITVQDKDGEKQFRIFRDDKFERLFKLYGDKVKLGIKGLIFSFDGVKVSPTESPDGLGMEDDDIIEVHVKSS